MLHHLAERLRKVRERDGYINQHIDNFNFLVKGVVLGVLGGMLGSSIDRELAQFGITYIALLASTLVLLFYMILNSVSIKARKLHDENLVELEKFDEELKEFKTAFDKADDVDPRASTKPPLSH